MPYSYDAGSTNFLTNRRHEGLEHTERTAPLSRKYGRTGVL